MNALAMLFATIGLAASLAALDRARLPEGRDARP